MTTVVLVDDQQLVRDGLRLILELAGIDVVGEAADGEEGVRLVLDLRPDVVLMDLRMPRVDGIEATRRIVAAGSTTRVLVLTTFEGEELTFRALQAGAAGYLLKDAGGARLVVRGRGGRRRARCRWRPRSSPGWSRPTCERPPRPPSDPARLAPLSDRERDVLALIGAGRSNPGDRRGAVHLPGDGEEPRPAHPGEAGPARPAAGDRAGPRVRAGRRGRHPMRCPRCGGARERQALTHEPARATSISSVRLSKSEAKKQLAAAQERLVHLRLLLGGQIGPGELGPPLCVLFEGWDASGKGGAIQRLVGELDPRHVRVAQFAAPTHDEKRHHFLWRFWPVLPGWGGMAVLDRTWYGRVLVERVEGFAPEEAWQRAYAEIVDLETTLAAEGTILVKFWMHVSPEEQLRRFESRQDDPYKAWKLTDEDWRNREKRPAYEAAVEEMLERTDTAVAPWHVVAADDKRWARVDVVRTVNEAIESALKARGIDPDPPLAPTAG